LRRCAVALHAYPSCCNGPTRAMAISTMCVHSNGATDSRRVACAGPRCVAATRARQLRINRLCGDTY